MRRYTNSQLADMYFMYEAAQENAVEAKMMYYRERCESKDMIDSRTFRCLNWVLCASLSFYASVHDMDTLRHRKNHAV